MPTSTLFLAFLGLELLFKIIKTTEKRLDTFPGARAAAGAAAMAAAVAPCHT